MSLRAIALIAIWLLAIDGHGHIKDLNAGNVTTEAFGQKLELARKLNTTAPWPESQELLEELRPHLDRATEDQYADFVYLEARNLTLAGHTDEALALLNDALEGEMSPDRRIHILRLAANIAINARRFEPAFSMLTAALALAEDQSEDVYTPALFSLASYIYTQVDELHRGFRYGQLALEEARAIDDLRMQCAAEQRLAYLHKVAGDFEPSRALYRDAIEHCLAAGDKLYVGVAEAGLADLLREHGEYESVVDLFERSIERLERTGYTSGVVEARLYWARLENAHGNWEKAEALLVPSIEQFEAEESWDYLAEAHSMLADIERGRGNLNRALDHYDQYMQAREKHLTIENAQQLAYLQVEFDMQSKDQQLALLREQARVSELEAETRRQQVRLTMIGYVIAGFLLIVLTLLLVQATRERRRFQSLSQHDGLTALSNHTRFFELAEAAYDLCQQKNVPFILILADIDHFKQVNDRNGHLAGDEVLRRVGARLRECFGKKGIIGRIGGEEFGIALPGERPEDIRDALEQFRESMTQVRTDDTPATVTMSFGIAAARATPESLTQLRERADQALYEAKHSGRDRVVYAD
ncbi:MAG: diguanylate cyclase [Wenzhouxiangellaceae bacterium]